MSRNYSTAVGLMAINEMKKLHEASEKQTKQLQNELTELKTGILQEQKKAALHAQKQAEVQQQLLRNEQLERAARQEIFELRQQLGKLKTLPPSLSAILELTRFSSRLKAVPMQFVTDLEAKQFHATTCQAYAVIANEIVAQLGQDVFEQFLDFCGQVTKLTTIAKTVAAGGTAARQLANSYAERLELFEQELDALEQQAKTLPEVKKLSIGIWPECRSWKKTVLRDGWKNWFVLKCCALMVKCDGKIESDERASFTNLAQTVKLSEYEIDELLNRTTNVDSKEMKRADMRPDVLLAILIKIACIDGELATPERKLLSRIAEWLKFPKEELQSLIEFTLKANPVWLIDVQRAESFIPPIEDEPAEGFFGKAAKILKDSVRFFRRPEELTDEQLRSLKKELLIDDGRTILLTYQCSTEKAALTDRHLHFLPKTAKSPGVIPVEQISDIRNTFGVSTIEADGKSVNLMPAANKFMNIVKQILDNCLKTIE